SHLVGWRCRSKQPVSGIRWYARLVLYVPPLLAESAFGNWKDRCGAADDGKSGGVADVVQRHVTLTREGDDAELVRRPCDRRHLPDTPRHTGGESTECWCCCERCQGASRRRAAH